MARSLLPNMTDHPNHHHDGEHDHSHVHSDEVKKFMVSLTDKKEIAEGTMAFHFGRPEGFEFRAGQHAEWTLLDPPETDGEGNSRMLSLVSSPSENNLTIATRMRDTAFKRVLRLINIGDTLQVANPHGSFTLHNDAAKPAVFLIGGIGITPVLSIIKDATERKLPHHLVLFYSNKRPEDTPFLEKLKNLAKRNSNFKFIPTMTEVEKSSQAWSGETGYITVSMIEKYLPNLKASIYYLSGPPDMVASMQKVLNDAGVNDDTIKTEEFTGY